MLLMMGVWTMSSYEYINKITLLHQVGFQIISWGRCTVKQLLILYILMYITFVFYIHEDGNVVGQNM